MAKTVGLVFKTPASKFTCPVCGNEYATESGLSKHLKEKHPEYNPDNAAGGA